MCDTIIAAPSATKNNHMLFGKNSDREPDEVQNLIYIPAQDYQEGTELQCTYVSIPQVTHTHAVLLSQPFWMFGAEMGINEFGVVIGNEALMTKIKPSVTGLTGMDLLRLALERSSTASEARDTIISLLENHGQGGMCGYRHQLQYMNGYLIGDPQHAFVLEIVEKEWAWKEIHDVWSISNKISLTNDFDNRSENLIHFAIEKGWCKSEADFNFAQCYSDKVITWGARARGREQDNRQCLLQNKGNLTLQHFMDALRTHDSTPTWHPSKGLRMTVCAHATNNLTRATQSVNSLVVENITENPIILTTGASNPCISPYFPIKVSPVGLPQEYQQGEADFSVTSFWWLAEALHREVMPKYKAMYPDLKQDIEEYDSNLKVLLNRLRTEKREISAEEINSWFRKVKGYVQKWTEKTSEYTADPFQLKLQRYWKKYNLLNHIS